VNLLWPSVLSLNILKVLKIPKTKAVKNIFIQEIFCFYNPKSALNDFPADFRRPAIQSKNQYLASGQLQQTRDLREF